LETVVKKILITGINGYIGTVLAEILQKKGYDVLGLDTNFFKNITLGKTKKTYREYKKDIRKIDGINLKDIDCIIHLAALSNDPMGELDKKLTYDINFLSTIRLAKKAKKEGVKRFIFSSSCSVYGKAGNKSVNEKSKLYPVSHYARSKIKAERELKKLSDENFCVCILRNATVHGYSPRFRNDLVVNNLVTCAMALSNHRYKRSW